MGTTSKAISPPLYQDEPPKKVRFDKDANGNGAVPKCGDLGIDDGETKVNTDTVCVLTPTALVQPSSFSTSQPSVIELPTQDGIDAADISLTPPED